MMPPAVGLLLHNFTRLLVLLLLAVLLLSVANPAAAQDPTDPAPIDLGDITALPQPAFRSARLAGEAAAVQTYQFTLTAAQAVGLGVRQQDADADLYLAEATGTERGRSEAAGTAKEWIQATLLAGTYTVRVEAREAGENRYVLRYGVSAPDADEVARLEAEQDDDDDGDGDDNDDAADDDADAADAAPTPPAPPTGLLGAASHTSVVLLWDAPGDATITGYRLLRRVRTDGTELAVLAEDTGSAAPTYTDDTVVPETAYEYRVQAVNAAGVSEPSGPAHVTTPAAPAAPDFAEANTVATDKAALVALYNATDGANSWTTKTNWTTDQALSSWSGVTTNSDGRVTRLVLNNNGLTGTLPTELGDLSELEQLNLEDNALSGALPSELADLDSLQSLLLERSRALTGPLPDGLRELANLNTVHIWDTELCAPDNDDFQTWWSTGLKLGLICPPAAQSVIDVAVFYTQAARDDAGGTEAIEDEIDSMVSGTNWAYRWSSVNQRRGHRANNGGIAGRHRFHDHLGPRHGQPVLGTQGDRRLEGLRLPAPRRTEPDGHRLGDAGGADLGAGGREPLGPGPAGRDLHRLP